MLEIFTAMYANMWEQFQHTMR